MPLPNFQSDRLTRPEAAQYLGLKPTTLEADVVFRRLNIPFYRIGSRVFYRRSDLDQWLESRRIDADCRIPA